jgi:hypothetical protein
VDYFIALNEIQVQWKDNDAKYLITVSGTIALYDNRYLDFGKQDRFSKFKEIIGMISAIIITAIALFTFIQNYIEQGGT